MNKLINLDVLIVYAESMAASASDGNESPFPSGSCNESYNIVYGYFLEVCDNLNLNAAFTTSADIVGPGRCRSFWSFKNKKWSRINTPCYSDLIFDKFSPTNKKIRTRRQLLFSSAKVKPFNSPALFNLFFDKQKTYEGLLEYSIPTISLVGDTLQSVARQS